MSLAKEFLPIESSGGGVDTGMLKKERVPTSRISQGVLTNVYGKEAITRPIFRSNKASIEGRATPFDNNISVLESEYSNWINSGNWDPYSAQISELTQDKDILDPTYYTERLRTLEDSRASLEKEKADRLAEIEALKTSRSRWKDTLGTYTGSWEYLKGPSSKVSSRLSSRLGTPIKVVKTLPVEASTIEESLMGYLDQENPYEAALADLGKKKAEWQAGLKEDPYISARVDLATKRKEFEESIKTDPFINANLQLDSLRDYIGTTAPSAIDSYTKSISEYDSLISRRGRDVQRGPRRQGNSVFGSQAQVEFVPYTRSELEGLRQKKDLASSNLETVKSYLAKAKSDLSTAETSLSKAKSDWESQKAQSLASFNKAQAQLDKYESYYSLDAERAQSEFSRLEDLLRKKSLAFESQKDFVSPVTVSNSQGLSIGSEDSLSSNKSVILRAYLEGQRDLQSLSTYSGLPLTDVAKALQDLKKEGRLRSPYSSSIVSSKVTSGSTSGTSPTFWKRVTSI